MDAIILSLYSFLMMIQNEYNDKIMASMRERIRPSLKDGRRKGTRREKRKGRSIDPSPPPPKG
jgi:hypothetical protein